MQIVGFDRTSGQSVYGTPDGRMWIPAHGGAVPYSPAQGGFVPVQGAQQGVTFGAYQEPPPPAPGASAVMRPPDMADLVAEGWYRRPFYPTAPIFAKKSARVTRFYSTGLATTDTDYPSVGGNATRTVRFDTPCVLVAMNGAAFSEAVGNAFPVGVGPRGCWTIDVGYGQNTEKLTVFPRLAETVVGSGERPGEIGGDGWVINPGNVVTITFSPLIASLRIDVTLVCLEQRGLSSFVNPS